MISKSEHVFDLIPAYALGCLEEGEAIQVAEHLDLCGQCRAELNVYQTLVDQMALAAPEALPSAEVKQGLLDRVQGGISQPILQKKDTGKRRGSFAWLSSPAWGFASLAVVAVLLASNLLLWRQVTQPQPASQTNALQVVNLSGTDMAPGATGMIIMSKNGENGTLVVDRLPVLSEKQQYQLWLIEDGKRTNGGVFSVGYGGYASLWVDAPAPLSDYDSFGITIEPAGGSPGPTGEKVLGG